jgi:hypothetical protein
LKKKGSAFSFTGAVKDRSSVLYELEEPSIIPHVAEQNQQKFTYEVIFRSTNHLLMDTASSEYIFDSEFFSGVNQLDLAHAIFDKITALFVVSCLAC